MTKIQRLRKKLKLSVAQLAAKAGVTHQTIYNMEKEYHQPTVPTLKKIASALKCKWADLA